MSEHDSIWQKIEAWWHLLWHHAHAGTLPDAPVAGGVPVTIPPVGGTVTPTAPPLTPPLPTGFASAPNEHGYVQLAQVEADRAQYAHCGDADYEVWANDLPRWYAIDDTLAAFTLTPAQDAKLRADLAQAETLLALAGAGDWFANRAANLPDSAAFSGGGQDPAHHGVHLRNIAQALAHQRAHAKAIAAGTNPKGSGAVAGPTHPGHGGDRPFRNADGSFK